MSIPPRIWPRAILILGAVALAAAGPTAVAAPQIPGRLTGREFWQLIQEFSEPDGVFQSDNLVSNEIWFQHVIGDLVEKTERGDIYIGVGSEQNFTYVAAIQPKAAFIVDVRRGNLQLHLMYKALLELSSDRATFVSRLFGRPLPRAGTATSASGLFAVLESSAAKPKESSLEHVFESVRTRLVKTDQLPLSTDDLSAIKNLLSSFHTFGPNITYGSTAARRGYPTYADLMVATDGTDARSYLSTEARFRVVKDLEERNLIVPVVGNFGGPKALRAIGSYAREHGATIAAMYVSNVEQYLVHDGAWNGFCRNVASMPLDSHSTFIRSSAMPQTNSSLPGGLMSFLGGMVDETKACAR